MAKGRWELATGRNQLESAVYVWRLAISNMTCNRFISRCTHSLRESRLVCIITVRYSVGPVLQKHVLARLPKRK